MPDWPKKIKTRRFTFNVDNIKEMIGGIQGLEGIKLEVGVLKGKAVNKEKTGYDDVAKIAITHEYGAISTLPNGKVIVIPPRSFLRSTLKQASKDIIPKTQIDLIGFVLRKRKLPGAKEIRAYAIKSLNSLGSQLKGAMRLKIVQGLSPPLHPKTVEKKRKEGLPFPETPLIATGTLWQHINYKVREHGRFTKKDS